MDRFPVKPSVPVNVPPESGRTDASVSSLPLVGNVRLVGPVVVSVSGPPPASVRSPERSTVRDPLFTLNVSMRVAERFSVLVKQRSNGPPPEDVTQTFDPADDGLLEDPGNVVDAGVGVEPDPEALDEEVLELPSIVVVCAGVTLEPPLPPVAACAVCTCVGNSIRLVQAWSDTAGRKASEMSVAPFMSQMKLSPVVACRQRTSASPSPL
jgi:hypothetical protein